MTPQSPFKDYFSEGSSDYARRRPTYPIELVDTLAGLSPTRGLAWDCGCGSGQLSAILVDRFERVIATDASAAQIAEAVPHARIEYRVALAEASGLSDCVVDLAVAAQAAHWFALDPYYAEVRRVCRPGACVALVTYNPMRVTPPVDEVVDDFYWRVLPAYWPTERRHVDDGYRSFAFPFVEARAPSIEIRSSWSLADVIGYVETWSAVRALFKAGGRDTVAGFFERLRAAWGDADVVRDVRAPIAMRVGHV